MTKRRISDSAHKPTVFLTRCQARIRAAEEGEWLARPTDAEAESAVREFPLLGRPLPRCSDALIDTLKKIAETGDL